MTLADRCEAFAAAFPKFPAAHPTIVQEQGREVLYATWLLGNDYRAKSELYGAYPPRFLDRVWALFPDRVDAEWDVPMPGKERWRVLHAFSGSLRAGPYIRVDLFAGRRPRPDFLMDVCDLRSAFARNQFVLTFADPPYSAEDAAAYGTPTLDRRKAISAIAAVTQGGGHLCWLDTTWPMFRKDEWRTVGRITVIRSTNHRVRMLTIFERVAA